MGHYHSFKTFRITDLHSQPEQGSPLIIRYDSKADQGQIVRSDTRREQINRKADELLPFRPISPLSEGIQKREEDKQGTDIFTNSN